MKVAYFVLLSLFMTAILPACTTPRYIPTHAGYLYCQNGTASPERGRIGQVWYKKSKTQEQEPSMYKRCKQLEDFEANEFHPVQSWEGELMPKVPSHIGN